MIYSDKGNVHVKGDIPSVMADLIVVIQSLIAEGYADREIILKAVDEFAYGPQEFAKRKAKQEIIDEIDKMDNIGDALNLLGQVLSDRRFS